MELKTGKKLVNIVILSIFVITNLITPFSFSQDYEIEGYDVIDQGYDIESLDMASDFSEIETPVQTYDNLDGGGYYQDEIIYEDNENLTPEDLTSDDFGIQSSDSFFGKSMRALSEFASSDDGGNINESDIDIYNIEPVESEPQYLYTSDGNLTPSIESTFSFEGVTVSVSAPEGAFPGGTTVSIIPVNSNRRLQVIQDKILSGVDESMDKSEIVAFDISFLAPHTGVEIQPFGTNTVKVSFDYSDHQALSSVDTDEQMLKLYHIDDEGEVETVYKDGTSTTPGKIVANVNSFSVYAIIKANFPENITVHYDAVDGYFSGNNRYFTVNYTLNNGQYVVDTATQQPQKASSGNTGYMFAGWYTDMGYTTRWYGVAGDVLSTDITVYAKYLPFTDQTISMGDMNIVIMDRNMGATDNTGIDAYGYYYQRGNNFGFDNDGGWMYNSTTQVTNPGTARGPSNYYSNSTFITRSSSTYRWDVADNSNLWGGASNLQSDRQGPCPDGYHIPNSAEWSALYSLYTIRKSTPAGSALCGTLSNELCMSLALGLPLAGYRGNSNAASMGKGEQGYYWSATRVDGNSAYSLNFAAGIQNPQYSLYRTNGVSLRCFKNVWDVTITFDSNGGSDVSSQIFKRWEPRTTSLKPLPTKAGEDFGGWFTDSGLQNEFLWSNTGFVDHDITLYARWGCEPGYVASGGTCVLRNVTVNYMLGNTLYKTMLYKRNTLGQYLPNTTSFLVPQTGGNYMFDQWYLDPEFTTLREYPQDNDGLGQSVTVYGRFLPFEEKTIDLGDGTMFTMMDRNLGAKAPSSGYNDLSTDNIGYYYQYGNNYGFPNTGAWTNVTNSRVTNPTSTEWSRTNPYSNGLFVTVSARGTNSYTNLWGGYSAHSNPDSYKQGPCPTGYHIPESNEWAKVYNIVIANKSKFTECNGVTNSVCFAKVMGLPFGGYRQASTTQAVNWGSTTYYGASTYYSYFQGYLFQMTSSAGSTTSWAGINASLLRCFKDTPRYTLTFNTLGGTTASTQYIWWRKPYSAVSSTRMGSIFDGWYLDTSYQNVFNGTVNSNTTVYARWECDTANGYSMDDDGNCFQDIRIMVNFIANPSTDPSGYFSDGTTSKSIEYFITTGGYFATMNEIQVPQKDAIGDTGYMFEGWYTDTGYSIYSRWTGLSSTTTYTGITLYARYLPFKDKTVNRGGASVTIMDRNLGALDYSSGYSYNNTQSTAYGSNNIRTRIGNYYQWGNNFGFPNRTHTASANGTTAAYPNSNVTNMISNFGSTTRGPGNYYFNGLFVRRPESPYRWDAPDNRNLWGGNGETRDKANLDTDKQGPCPEGYHIPGTYEWLAIRNLFQKWQATAEGMAYCASLHATNTGIQFCMPAALGLPFVGYRYYSSAGVRGQGTIGRYWSARAYNTNNAYDLSFSSSALSPQDWDSRADGFSLRCFKDSPNLTLSFDSNGGTNVASRVGFKRWNPMISSYKPKNPTRANSTFVDRFVDSDLTEAFARTTTTYISKNTTLYAKWRCNAGYQMSTDGQRCERAYQITFNATTNGGQADSSSYSAMGGTPIVLSGFTARKDGWIFVGRNTDPVSTVAMEDFTLTQDVTLYAIFRKIVSVQFHKNGNDSQAYFGSNYIDEIIGQSCSIRNSDTSCTVHTPQISSTNTPVVIGYSTGADIHTDTYPANTDILVSDDIDLYAQTQSAQVPRYITFNPNGNFNFTYSGDTQTETTSYILCVIPATYNGVLRSNSCNATVTFPDFTTTSSSKHALGWSTSANDHENLINTGSIQSFVAIGDYTYYAQSSTDSTRFTATFYGNGASISGANSQVMECNTEISYNGGNEVYSCDVQIPSILRTGFTILGYSTDENAHTASVARTGTVTLTSDTSFYAITQKLTTTTFYKNNNYGQVLDDGYGIDDSDSVDINCTIRNKSTNCTIRTPEILSIYTPNIIGYSTGANIHTSTVAHNSDLVVSSDAAYYAQSQKNARNISITFHLNENNGFTYNSVSNTGDTTYNFCTIDTGYNEALQATGCNRSITMPTISPNSNTTTVLGWSTGATNHIVSYQAGQNYDVYATDNIHLYAQSTTPAQTFTATFVSGTGVASIGYNSTGCTLPATFNGGRQDTDCDIIFPSFVIKTGYQDPMWLSAVLGSYSAGTTSVTASSNASFTLGSSIISYDISYSLGGGTMTSPKTTYTVTDNNFTIQTPTKNGYTFLGWTGSNGNIPQTGVVVPKGTYGNLSYSANWKIDSYTISYDLASGYLDGVNPTRYTVESGNITLINPERTGYTFVGWWGTSLTRVTRTVTISHGSTGNRTYIAVWTPNTDTSYTVNHYVQNIIDDGYTLTGTDNMVGTTDTQTQAKINQYAGFTAQPLVQQNIDGDGYTHVDIYYDRNIYTIQINLNGGTGVQSLTGKYESTIIPPSITRDGYQLKKYSPGLPETMPLDGAQVKAVWVLSDGAVTISIDSGSDTLRLGDMTISNESQEVTGGFADNTFMLYDTRGEETGYHATLSMGNLVGASNSSHVIPSSNIWIKSDGMQMVSGSPIEEIGLTSMLGDWTIATGQVTYFTRGDIEIVDECKVGVYGSNLDIRVLIPSHTVSDTYQGVITYTLY